jgi:hypothetical protein
VTSRLAIALSLLLAAGCAQDLTDLAPFPCAGDGTCPESLTCATSITAEPGGTCVAECSSSIECEEGSRCSQVDGAGACLPECEPFGTDCDPGTTCRLQPLSDEGGYFATCIATVAESQQLAPCDNNRDCAGHASCYRESSDQPGTCRPHCDSHHECRRNMTCEPLLPSGAGVCI